jgi:hypothetical protein
LRNQFQGFLYVTNFGKEGAKAEIKLNSQGAIKLAEAIKSNSSLTLFKFHTFTNNNMTRFDVHNQVEKKTYQNKMLWEEIHGCIRSNI